MGKIHCKGCQTYLGNIEGVIHKDITYLCKVCEQKRVALELKYHNKDRQKPCSNIFEELFKDHF